MDRRYLVNWAANSGATYSSFTASNLREAERTAAQIVRGNLFPGGVGGYTIYDAETHEFLKDRCFHDRRTA